MKVVIEPVEIFVGEQLAVQQEILADYRSSTNDDAVALRRAVSDGNGTKVARMAHRIKGASKTVGAEELARVCDRLERASREFNWKSVETQMVAFEAEWRRLSAHLDAR